MNILIVPLGILFGLLWFRFGERFNQDKLEPQCWEKLHYYNKEALPLYVVHLKSVLAGLILIILSFSKYKYKNHIICFIGSAIVGLHLYQIKSERKLIDTLGKERYKQNFIL